MLTRTLADLTSDVRDRSDLGDSQFRTDTQIKRYLNSSNRQMTAKLIALYGSDYLAANDTINTVSGTAYYNLPSDCFAPKFFRITLDGHRMRIPRATVDDIDVDDDTLSWGKFGVIPQHRVMKDQVLFTPTPNAVHVITVHYISTAIAFEGGDDSRIEEMVNTDDYIQGYWNYEEWVVLNAAIKVKNDQEEDPTSLMIEQRAIWDDIVQIAGDRTTTEPEKIRDAYPEYDIYDIYYEG